MLSVCFSSVLLLVCSLIFTFSAFVFCLVSLFPGVLFFLFLVVLVCEYFTLNTLKLSSFTLLMKSLLIKPKRSSAFCWCITEVQGHVSPQCLFEYNHLFWQHVSVTPDQKSEMKEMSFNVQHLCIFACCCRPAADGR